MTTTRQHAKLDDIPSNLAQTFLEIRDEIDYKFSVESINLDRCSIVGLGIRDANFRGGSITNCIVDNLYGKRAKFYSIDFTGTTFINCNFKKASFSNCNFRYCKFLNCDLPVEEIISCLPKEPNLRKELATRLKTNYKNQGEGKVSDRFLNIEIQAEKEELKEIIRSKTTYYKDRYDLTDKINCFFRLNKYRIHGFLWGYGHRIDKLFLSFITIFVFYSIIVFLTKNQYIPTGLSAELHPSIFESVAISLNELLNLDIISFTSQTHIGNFILALIKITGIIYIGLFIATLYRKIAR